MKKFSLFFVLSLGLLLVKTDAFASACYSDGCHLRNGVPWEMFFFDKGKRLIGSLPGDSPHPIVIPEDSFPVYVSGCEEMNNPHKDKCTMWKESSVEAGCYVVWAWLKESDPVVFDYTFTRWSCLVGKETGESIQNNPPPGAVTPKSALKPSPQKQKEPPKKNAKELK